MASMGGENWTSYNLFQRYGIFFDLGIHISIFNGMEG